MKNKAIRSGVFSVQWFVFLLANSLMLPLLVGKLFHLPPEEIVELIQRMFFVVGVSSFLSAWLGHRLPIADGPAGIWVGIFILMGQLGAAKGTDPYPTLRLLEGGMLITGVIAAVIGFAGWMRKLLRIFTPLVTGVYLMLLALQLSGSFLKGMIGIGDAAAPAPVHPVNAILSFAVFILVLALSVSGKGWLRSYAVLIGVIVGWTAFVLVNGAGNVPSPGSVIRLPNLLAWGMPRLDGGMVITSILVAFVLISSLIASMSAMHQVVGEEEQREGRMTALDRGGIIAGVTNLLSGLFSAIGVVPMSISAGFVRLTGQRSLKPYFIACIALIVVSCLPGVYSMLSLLPAQVAYAAMLASFAQMIGIGLLSILKTPIDERRMTILGLALSFGTGVMFLPQELFNALPTVFQYILSNGVMVGMSVALLLEQVWRTKPMLTTASAAASSAAADKA